jgi:hypothetical protein
MIGPGVTGAFSVLSSASAAAAMALSASSCLQPRARQLPLDVYLLRPIANLRLAQLVTQLRELGAIGPSGIELAGVRGAQGTGEMHDRHDLGELALPHVERRRALVGRA